ncbi:T-cell surface glycoprotein CD8 alpha chain-like isoform X3 [Passer montanus]|uniref:T-cell surface glycoprotein CD8 alpha chain-like isoform X3 n=1 Tax=Passer montanus TaxID=9160 RepID=UPI001962214D|nr:T-cell surface glycoprotein CD8 alpha chain-like isoform X3 [Passer montanus]
MDMAPALLLLLTLGFCCPGIYGQSLQIKLRYPRDITQLQVGQKLELECHTDRSHGASWIRQDRSGTLHFIVFINALSRATFGENQRSTRFEASKDNTIYRLAVKSFTPQDEGSYFCVMNFNQMLHFSPGLRAFLPVAPSTPGPTTQRGITEDPDLTTPDPAEERMQENLNFFCHIFIWVPLAGALLLLLIALVITIVLCRQTRRRRCRCKRPANRKPPTKPRTPN